MTRIVLLSLFALVVLGPLAPARGQSPTPPAAVPVAAETKLVTLTQAPTLPTVQRLSWGLIERENAVPTGGALSREFYAKTLDALGLRLLPAPSGQAPGPQDADFALGGTADYYPESADEGQKGARLRLFLTLDNLGSGERLLSQPFEAYGAAKTYEDAKRAALGRLSEPLSVTLCGAIRQALARGIAIRLVVDGFSARDEQEDFELVMASVKGFFDYHLLPANHDRLEFEVTIKEDSLGGFLTRCQNTQGLGLSAGQVTPRRITARYSLSRAFHLPGVVLALPGAPEQSPALLQALETELKKASGLFRLVYMPSRLAPALPQARREFATQYGSGLLLLPKLTGETLSLTLFAGNGATVDSVSGAAQNGGLEALVNELLTKLPAWLKSKGSFLTGLRARQYKAWRNEG